MAKGVTNRIHPERSVDNSRTFTRKKGVRKVVICCVR